MLGLLSAPTELVMSLYRETMDGSTIKERDMILVWNYVGVNRWI
jgi:hypothetical protein